MADPVTVPCTKESWTKVATGVTAGVVHLLTEIDQTWLQTYRDTTGAVPTLRSEGVKFGKDSISKETDDIKNAVAIDVYVWPDQKAGSVRVDL